ncbi:MAG: aldo/keto reductase, partial [Candidatus Dormibacteraeota bacterium]|nr:aldo/keto reductase [Candidatus Dormibacteraeota bacterium]
MAASAWLEPAGLRVGLGCMRLWSAGGTGPDALPEAAVAAALDAGISVFDTARTYDGPGGVAGGNERELSRLLRARGAGKPIHVVTKGGMRREGAAWIPDGRARTLRGDCEASLAALDGTPIGVYLLHAPDPSRPWTTSLRALT